MHTARACRGLFVAAITVVCIGPVCRAQPARVEPAPPGSTSGLPESPLTRVAFIGASVSAGFFSTFEGDARVVTAERAFRATLAEPDAAATFTFATAMFFTSPGTHGPIFVKQALESNPTLLVAADFLFWFGYGTHDTERRSLRTTEDRVRLLETGLSLLDRHKGPLVVGDFPDMSDAVGGMLSPWQVPSAEAREKLNARVREWAGARPDTIVLPFADLVAQIKAGKGVKIGGREWTAEQAGAFLTADNLHPSPHGQAAMAVILADAIDGHFESVAAGDFRPDFNGVIERLRAPDAP